MNFGIYYTCSKTRLIENVFTLNPSSYSNPNSKPNTNSNPNPNLHPKER